MLSFESCERSRARCAVTSSPSLLGGRGSTQMGEGPFKRLAEGPLRRLATPLLPGCPGGM